jgi:hypothetical protein
MLLGSVLLGIKTRSKKREEALFLALAISAHKNSAFALLGLGPTTPILNGKGRA